MIPKEQLPDILKSILKHDEDLLSIFQNTVTKNINFLVTDLRVINCQRKNKIESYSYSSIFSIQISIWKENGPFLILHRQPDLPFNTIPPDSVLLANISNLREAKQIIEKAWFPQSPYAARVKPFELLVQKYNLTIKPIEFNINNIITMSGVIHDMKMTFSLANILKLNQLHITFLCPNSENNFLSIVHEKMSDGISKLFGKQDIITKDKSFDKRFLLQSDHQRFFDFVITPEIRKALYDASHYVEADIIFGKKKKKEKAKKKNQATTFDILDEHLLDELLPVLEHDDDLNSQLFFHAKNLRNHLTNIDILLEYCVKYFEVIVQISGRIKEYDNKGKS